MYIQKHIHCHSYLTLNVARILAYTFVYTSAAQHNMYIHLYIQLRILNHQLR